MTEAEETAQRGLERWLTPAELYWLYRERRRIESERQIEQAIPAARKLLHEKYPEIEERQARQKRGVEKRKAADAAAKKPTNEAKHGNSKKKNKAA